MKPTTIITALFATLALAAPSAENPTTADIAEGSLPMRRDVVQTLAKRGCPSGASCQKGQCYWWSCSTSGWCTANPSKIKC